MNLDHPYDRLAALPRALWLPGLVTSVGPPARRLADVERWRAALRAGQAPPADAHFGDPQALAPLRRACVSLGLPALCRGTEALADQVLRTLLWHLDRLIDLQPLLSREAALSQVTEEFLGAWQQEKGDWEELMALLQGLGELPQVGREALRGLLRSREWAEAQRIAGRLAQMPEIVALMRHLGRAERAGVPPALPPAAAAAVAPPRLGLKAVETRLPDAPGELRGIRLSGRIEGMLGSEAAMLLHPVLHKLWRARRAEQRLLTYDSQALLVDWRPDPAARAHRLPEPPRPAPLQRGPIVLCLDTSGSMRGAPETLAKAVALEALRTAHRERRGCVLIAFGGPGEVVERELAPTHEGLQALLALMGQVFDGGTDVQAPIERAIERVHEQQWTQADLLIVSDGEFGCVPATLDRLDEARARLGLRVQGVLVGDRETLGLMEVADHIHWVRDWRRHGDADERRTGSPVHSKSLTALYFPNALSERAARHRPA